MVPYSRLDETGATELSVVEERRAENGATCACVCVCMCVCVFMVQLHLFVFGFRVQGLGFRVLAYPCSELVDGYTPYTPYYTPYFMPYMSHRRLMRPQNRGGRRLGLRSDGGGLR
jgi:hypothetical protein